MGVLSSYLLENAGVNLRPLILMYHGICDDGEASRWSVSIDEFNRQLGIIKEAGLRPGRISDLAAGNATNGEIYITFDDGLKNNLLAVDSLVSHSMVASWYVVASAIGKVADWEDDKPRGEAMLGWDDLRDMQEAGMEMGSHGLDHVRMNVLDDRRLEEQLRESRLMLEDKLSESIQSLAYPYGAVDERVSQFAEKSGYRLGLTCRSGFINPGRHSRLLLPRVAVYGQDSISQFCRKLAFASNRVGNWALAKYVARRAASKLGL